MHSDEELLKFDQGLDEWEMTRRFPHKGLPSHPGLGLAVGGVNSGASLFEI